MKRRYLIWLWLGIALALIAAVALARQGDPALVRESRGAGVVTTASGLKYKILKPAEGAPRPTDADVALVQYEGRLLDGARAETDVAKRTELYGQITDVALEEVPMIYHCNVNFVRIHRAGLTGFTPAPQEFVEMVDEVSWS